MPLAPVLAEARRWLGGVIIWRHVLCLIDRPGGIAPQHGEGSVGDLVEAMFGTLEGRVGRLPFG
jgi:hypothetical protein